MSGGDGRTPRPDGGFDSSAPCTENLKALFYVSCYFLPRAPLGVPVGPEVLLSGELRGRHFFSGDVDMSGTMRNSVIRRLYRESRGICIWCREQIPLEIATIEHVVPLSKGGGGLRNLAMACAPCNVVRGNSMGPPDPVRVKEVHSGVIAALRKSRTQNNEVKSRRAFKRQPNRRADQPTRFCLGQMIPLEIWEKLLPRMTVTGRVSI